MAKAIESILVGGEDVEIIIVNDGSKDHTSEIAHEYKEKYPEIITRNSKGYIFHINFLLVQNGSVKNYPFFYFKISLKP